MKTATIALLFATSVVDAAEAAKADAKKTDAAATGAPEGQACNSKTDKTGCSTGLKCAIGMKADPTPAEKKKADEAAKAAAEKEKADGQKALDVALAAAIKKWNADTLAVKTYTDAKKVYDDAVALNTKCEAVKKARADQTKTCAKAVPTAVAAWVAADKTTLATELANSGGKTPTKYACSTLAHTWKADGAKLANLAWKAAKSATLTAKFTQCTKHADIADQKACATKVEANTKAIADANKANGTKKKGDDGYTDVPAVENCCSDDKKTAAVDTTWTATGATMKREQDKTTLEEKWTIATVTGTQTTKVWNHTTGADLTTADVGTALNTAADTAGWKAQWRTAKDAKKTAALTDYNAATTTQQVGVANKLAATATKQAACVKAAYVKGSVFTATSKAPAAVTPKVLPKKGDAAYVWKKAAPKAAATTTKTDTKAAAKPAAKTDTKAAAKPAADAKKADTKAAAVPDGPGRCVKEALCDTTDEKTSAKITCEAVRLATAALAALAVASTL